ncbi:MAG: cytochrome c1 [Devosiaceae bacterium]|nr:cytochrome c1 [Devosiaceae bacterium]
MNKSSITLKGLVLGAVMALSGGLSTAPASAAVVGVEPELQSWTFAGIFGKYDSNQLQRGFQVFQEVCASCHGARLMSFRNLSEEGGPLFSEDQVKALAAEYIIMDPELVEGERAATPADSWPNPFETERDARGSNSGAFPPDFSVLAKARGVSQKFPFWAFNYFTGYQEGGPDYIYNLLVNYVDAPHDVEVPEGQSWNAYLGGTLAMGPPLFEGIVDYEGDVFPETVEQYSADIAAFMMWMAEPHLASRKEMGFRTITFLLLLAGMMYLVKRKIWSNVEH